MNRWISVTLIVGLVFATACAHPAPRSGPYVWQLRGTVVSVNDTGLRVRHKTGEIVELEIDDRTAYIRKKQPDSRQSLRRGTRVVIDVESIQPHVYRARRVQIYGGGRPD